MTASHRQRRAISATIATILVLASHGIVARFVDASLDTPSVDKPRSRAAVAIRDHVNAFQKYGTRAFTLPHLQNSYDAVYYYTQKKRGDLRGAFTEGLTDALRKHRIVDVFLLAHSNRFYRWVRDIEPRLRKRLRLIYNTGCGDARHGQRWLELGAETYVAHAGALSLSPVFYFYFLRRWVRGYPLRRAIAEANHQVVAKFRYATPFLPESVDAQRVREATQAIVRGNDALRISR